MAEAPDQSRQSRKQGRFARFVLADHRYVLLGTSVVALLGMQLSSQPRSTLSFLAHAYALEVVLYYVLVAWLAVSVVAFVIKLVTRRRYATVSPFTKPKVRRILRTGSYVIWAITLVLFVDRVVLGIAATWQLATTATSRPSDSFASALYMLWQGRQIF